MSAYMAGTIVDSITITPHDTNALSKVVNVIYIGGAGSGNLKVRLFPSGTIQAFTGLTAPFMLQVQCDLVYDTDTDVTGLVGGIRG